MVGVERGERRGISVDHTITALGLGLGLGLDGVLVLRLCDG